MIKKWRRCRWVRETAGSQMVELGFMLPLLLVLVVGIVDFAKAYNINHILTNAAREAAEMMAMSSMTVANTGCSWSFSNPSSGTPCSVQAAAVSVANYLNDNGLAAASCLSSASASYGGDMSWTYSCSNVTLVINHKNDILDSNNNVVPATEVTLSYPYTFSFGKVIGLLGATQRGPTGMQQLTVTAVMANVAKD